MSVSPGPWFAYYGYIIDADGQEIAEVKHEDDQALMAAAFELLAMLKRVLSKVAADEDFVRDMCEERHGKGSYSRNPSVDEADALIARLERG